LAYRRHVRARTYLDGRPQTAAIRERGSTKASRRGCQNHLGLRGRSIEVMRRVVTGVWDDGFIHAGNLAYMTMLAIFPFFIVMSAVFAALGEQGEQEASIHAFLTALPHGAPGSGAGGARCDSRAAGVAAVGWRLVGLWTVSSLIETIRDILRRAYGTQANKPFWRYRLLAGAGDVRGGGASGLALSSGAGQCRAAGGDRAIGALCHPRPAADAAGRAADPGPCAVRLDVSAVFHPHAGAYRARRYPKWPGARWSRGGGVVSTGLPVGLRVLLKYDLTYGSLAGVMISLFFFWLVGLGMVTGAELNAALATAPDDRDRIGQQMTAPAFRKARAGLVNKLGN
jgi:membrane protein